MAIDLSKSAIQGTTVVSQFCYSCTGSHDYHKHGMPVIYGPITIGEGVLHPGNPWGEHVKRFNSVASFSRRR
jgi:hypothetical protein